MNCGKKLLCPLLLFTAALSGCSSKQPHILLIVADDYGYHDIGYHGSEIATPNLDALAYGGVRLENYYVQPICTPTRSVLMSGRYQIHTGLQHGVIHPPAPNGLPLDIPTIADAIKEAGYSTHMVGKWHLGFYKKEYTPTYRGFDTFFGHLTGDEDYYSHWSCHEDMCGYDMQNNSEPVQADDHDVYSKYSTHLFTEKVIDIIDNHQEDEKPLFIYLPYQAVHGPTMVPEHYEEMNSHIDDRIRRIYAGMVTCLDEGVGNITEAMKRKGMWDNTLLVFTTDNGGQDHKGGYNWPLRGRKSTLWEGGIHGIGFVHSNLLSDHVKGTESKELLHVSDWFPTLVHVAGGNLQASKQLDGYNQWDTISHGANSARHELLHNIDPKAKHAGQSLYEDTFDTTTTAALRMGDWKIITGTPGYGRWKAPPHLEGKSHGIVETHPDTTDTKNLWLFNIAQDPTERTDLSAHRPDIVAAMLERLTYYEAQMVECRHPDSDPMANPALGDGYWRPWRD